MQRYARANDTQLTRLVTSAVLVWLGCGAQKNPVL
jgi:hypothetical protein